MNLTPVIWELWPAYFVKELFSTIEGNLKSLILLKSSAVAMTKKHKEKSSSKNENFYQIEIDLLLCLSLPSPEGALSTELISSPLEQGGHIPCVGHPSVRFQEAHFSSLYFVMPDFSCAPFDVE